MPLIRLIRPLNLLIVALTMYSMAWYFDTLFELSGMTPKRFSLSFFILVFSTVLIAAAGNIINDYFDVRADRVNRPERVVVGKTIKRRWAIVLHWLINFIAFGMAVYLSYRFKTFWYLFIHLLSINLLWGYSMQLKRTFLIGNVVVALLTGLVPVLVGIYYNQQVVDEPMVSYYPFLFDMANDYPLHLSFALGTFAFFLNWTREIVKDIEDIKGDKRLNAKTIPIVLGVKKAKLISLAIFGVNVLFVFLLVLVFNLSNNSVHKAFIPLLFAALFFCIAVFKLVKAKTKSQIKITHQLIKLIMVFGLILPFFWTLLLRFF